MDSQSKINNFRIVRMRSKYNHSNSQQISSIKILVLVQTNKCRFFPVILESESKSPRFQPTSIKLQPTSVKFQPTTIKFQPTTITLQRTTIQFQPTAIKFRSTSIKFTSHTHAKSNAKWPFESASFFKSVDGLYEQ